MNVSVEAIVSTLSLVGTGIALYFSIKKGNKEGRKLDAETVTELFAALKLANDRYDELEKEFTDYKAVMTKQINGMALENARIEREFIDYKRNTAKELDKLKYENSKLKDKIHVLEGAKT